MRSESNNDSHESSSLSDNQEKTGNNNVGVLRSQIKKVSKPRKRQGRKDENLGAERPRNEPRKDDLSAQQTRFTKFPCPKCGVYYEPYMTKKDGKALIECPVHGLFETSIAMSKSFRKYCSRIARKPNRSQTYYSSSEKAVKTYLERKGLLEGLNFQHNVRIKDGLLEKSQEFKGTDGKKYEAKWKYYWLDFVISQLRLVIEVDPEIWHKLGEREKSDKEKKIFINSFSWELISLNSNAIHKLNREFNSSKRPEACKKLDEMIGKLQKGVS